MFKIITFLLLFSFPFTLYAVDSYSVFDLEETVIKIPCDIDSYSPSEKYSDIMLIRVASHGYDPDDDSFEYKVSGGEIIGTGKEVKWNLFGAEPGTYTITVTPKHKDKLKKHKPVTKTITVEKHVCCCEHNCPENISVSAPMQLINAGETMFFNANMVNGIGYVNYECTVSKGEIIEGQGTPVIKVATTPEMAGEEIKATVKFGGEAFCAGTCYDEAFAIGKIRRTNPTIEVKSLTLDKNRAVIGCPPSEFFPKAGSDCTESKSIQISKKP